MALRLLPLLLLLISLSISTPVLAEEWVLRQELTADDLVASNAFQSSFGVFGTALDGRYAVVGNRRDDRSIGAAYVFDVQAGEQLRRLTPENGRRGDWFAGMGIDLSGTTAVIPKGLVDSGSRASIYLFDVQSGEQLKEYLPNDFGLRDLWIDYAIDGGLLAFNSGFGKPSHPVHFVDIETGEELLRLPHADHFDIKDGMAIVADRDENSAVVIDIDTEEVLHTFEPTFGDLPPNLSVALSEAFAALKWRDGPGTLGSDTEYGFDIYELATGDLVNTILTDGPGNVRLSDDYVVVNSIENISTFPQREDRVAASIYDIRTGEDVFQFPSLVAPGSSVDISGNTAIFAAPTEDREGGILYVATLSGVLGDFDSDGFFGALDIDLLSQHVRNGSDDTDFDLNSDGAVSESDRVFWVHEIANTRFGDANLDEQVDFSDFLVLSSSFGQDGDWALGDFDGSGDVAFPDFLLLAGNFGHTSIAAATVPEPSAVILSGLGLMVLIRTRTRR